MHGFVPLNVGEVKAAAAFKHAALPTYYSDARAALGNRRLGSDLQAFAVGVRRQAA